MSWCINFKKNKFVTLNETLFGIEGGKKKNVIVFSRQTKEYVVMANGGGSEFAQLVARQEVKGPLELKWSVHVAQTKTSEMF